MLTSQTLQKGCPAAGAVLGVFAEVVIGTLIALIGGYAAIVKISLDSKPSAQTPFLPFSPITKHAESNVANLFNDDSVTVRSQSHRHKYNLHILSS